jgi:hypothetical protein
MGCNQLCRVVSFALRTLNASKRGDCHSSSPASRLKPRASAPRPKDQRPGVPQEAFRYREMLASLFEPWNIRGQLVLEGK